MPVFCARPGFPLPALLLLLLLTPPAVAEDREGLKFFEAKVRPLLVQRCFKCHGEGNHKGNLRLDGRATLLAGGDSGPAVVPGKPGESLLIEAVNYELLEMPPDGRLSDEQIAVLTKWVAMGAPWPGTEDAAPLRPAAEKITAEDRRFWSFQPLRDAAPPEVEDATWVHNDIDRFILRRLDEAGLEPAPPAEPAVLIRRLYQNVVGLPPTPEQVDAFLGDPSEENYLRIVEGLLASPRYGEHMAHFWLDLVRYADSDGFRADFFRPNAWRYREYVIRAFNEDKPYDRFIAEQLAGDEIAPEDPEALAATGYLRHGVYEYNQRDAFTQWQDMLNDITDTTADAFLGLGLGCARCHDHKFDPLLQKDYYRLQAFFAPLALRDDVPFATPAQRAAHEQQRAAWEEQTADLRARLDALEAQTLRNAAHRAVIRFTDEIQEMVNKPPGERTPYEKQIAHLVHLQVLDEQSKIDAKFTGEKKKEREALRKQLAAFDDIKPPPLPMLRSASDVGPVAPAVFIPGRERLGEIAPGFLTVLDEGPATIPDVPVESTGRRTALARWLTRPDHPLTSRVMVNRLWQQHFGRGIVATPSDFGRLGEPPSHPELLDWLAIRFVESGWSLKAMHRMILTSATFRQSSSAASRRSSRTAGPIPSPGAPRATGGAAAETVVAGRVSFTGTGSALADESDGLERRPAAANIDPANRLLWRQNIRRLDAEQIRDALLAVAGELTTQAGGPPEDAAKSTRRSVYTKLLRNKRDELLAAFDLPDRITGTSERNVTTTPTQSLLMINGEWPLDRARAFARRLQREIPSGADSRVRHAYALAYGRAPSEEELKSAGDFLQSGDVQPPSDEEPPPVPERLIDFCHVLLNSNEFLYVD